MHWNKHLGWCVQTVQNKTLGLLMFEYHWFIEFKISKDRFSRKLLLKSRLLRYSPISKINNFYFWLFIIATLLFCCFKESKFSNKSRVLEDECWYNLNWKIWGFRFRHYTHLKMWQKLYCKSLHKILQDSKGIFLIIVGRKLLHVNS